MPHRTLEEGRAIQLQIQRAQRKADDGDIVPAISYAFSSLAYAMGEQRWSWPEIEAYLGGSLAVVGGLNGSQAVSLLRGQR